MTKITTKSYYDLEFRLAYAIKCTCISNVTKYDVNKETTEKKLSRINNDLVRYIYIYI